MISKKYIEKIGAMSLLPGNKNQKVVNKLKNNAYANLFKIMFENSFLIVMAMIRAKNKFKNQAK